MRGLGEGTHLEGRAILALGRGPARARRGTAGGTRRRTCLRRYIRLPGSANAFFQRFGSLSFELVQRAHALPAIGVTVSQTHFRVAQNSFVLTRSS